MRCSTFLIPFLLVMFIVITCTKDPSGPDISEDLKPKGTITGWVYDMWNRPIKDVPISVNTISVTAVFKLYSNESIQYINCWINGMLATSKRLKR